MSPSDKKALLTRAEKFLKKAHKKHGSKYDYKDVIYIDAKTEVVIRCDVHGPFEQTPDGHVQGRGCKRCGAQRRGKARRLGREKFIEKSIERHGNFYDYSKVIYEINSKKVIIICPDHGEFSQIAANHMNGEGCEDCAKVKRKKALTKTTEEFVKEAKRIHKKYYDYSSVAYEGAHANVNIICPEHGVFPQPPTSHLAGKGCPKCGLIKRAKKRRLTNKQFFEKAISVHGDRYDYSQVNYIGNDQLVDIKCRKHGIFQQMPHNHYAGKGCKDCGVEQSSQSKLFDNQEFVRRAEATHGDYYDYSKVDYVGADKDVKIICPIHGEFEQIAQSHWIWGCEQCGYEKTANSRRLSKEEFINRAREVHGDTYDYSQVEYHNSSTPVFIICKKHGEFPQAPGSHLVGVGCGRCKNKSEGRIFNYLRDFCVVIHQFRIDKTAYDFYLPEYNLIIERDGEQHYMVIAAWTHLSDDRQMKLQQEKDKKRTELAKKNGFNIARLPFWLADKHATKCTVLEKRELANILSGKPSFPEVPLLEQAITKPNPL